METPSFFSQLLNIQPPFSVTSVEYKQGGENDEGPTSIHIYLSVETSAPYRPQGSILHSYEERVWQHLNLFQYPCYLHCKVPKYQEKGSKKVKTLDVPWANTGSNFTLLFEEFSLELVKVHGCVAEVARQLKLYPQRLWRIVNTYGKHVNLTEIDMHKVRRIGYDETSRKKGHDYITCFIDLDTGDLLCVQEGKGAETVTGFAEQAQQQGFDKQKISDITIDMSPAFIAGAEQVFTNAQITFDKFHVSQLVQKAFDSVRKYFGRKEGGTINKWIFFKPYAQLTPEQQEELDYLLTKHPLLDSIYQLKNQFSKLWEQDDKLLASAFLSFWTDLMKTFKKKVLTTLANTLDKHHDRIINVIDSKITNAILEGFNTKIQTLKRKARGYKKFDTLIMMVKLHCA